MHGLNSILELVCASKLLSFEEHLHLRKTKFCNINNLFSLSTHNSKVIHENIQKLRLLCVASQVNENNQIHYCKYLSFLNQLRASPYLNENACFFSWLLPEEEHHENSSTNGNWITKNSIDFEYENVLLNYCIFLINLAKKSDSFSVVGIRIKLKYLQLALGICKSTKSFHFEDMFEKLFLITSYLCHLCYLEVALKDENRKSNSILKITNSIISFVELLQENGKCREVLTFWKGLRFWQAANAFYERNPTQIGISIAVLDESLRLFRMSSSEVKLNSFLCSCKEMIKIQLEKYVKENSLVHNQRIFEGELDLVKEFGSVNMAKAIQPEFETLAEWGFLNPANTNADKNSNVIDDEMSRPSCSKISENEEFSVLDELKIEVKKNASLQMALTNSNCNEIDNDLLPPPIEVSNVIVHQSNGEQTNSLLKQSSKKEENLADRENHYKIHFREIDKFTMPIHCSGNFLPITTNERPLFPLFQNN